MLHKDTVPQHCDMKNKYCEHCPTDKISLNKAVSKSQATAAVQRCRFKRVIWVIVLKYIQIIGDLGHFLPLQG